jgi:pilus assembly protein FimV
MIVKRSSRALALLLSLPSAAFALGLGDIRLLSPLNAPLDAEIDLVDAAPDELATLQAQIAPRDTFAQNGLDYPAYLSGIQVRTVRASDGRQIIKLKSTDPISEPFVTLLLEVKWSHGDLVREYTMLLDPPVYTPGNSQVASAPVTAPASGSGTREGAIDRSAQAAPAAAAASATAAPGAAAMSAPAPSAEASAAAAAETPAASAAPPPLPEPAPAPRKGRHAAAAAAASSAPAETTDSAGSSHTVQRGETLSGIASGVAGESPNGAHTRSWMLAIYQANPRAFDQNMNILRSGAVLRIPDAATAAAVSPGDAAAEIRRQYAAWRGGSAPEASASTAQPGRLKLVTPGEGAAAGTSSGAASSAEVSGLKNQVSELQGQLSEAKRLLDLKNADLARLQAQIAAKQGTQATPPAPEKAAPPPAPAVTAPPPPVAQTTPEAAPPASTPSEEKPAPPPVEAAPPVAAKPVAPKPIHKAPPAPSGGLFDTLASFWWVLLLVALGLVAWIASRLMRARRATALDDSLGRLAVAGAADAGGGIGARNFEPEDEEPMPAVRATAAPVAAPEAAFVVEESRTGTHERPRLTGAPVPATPAPRHVTSDETISSETAINLDQGDPLAEADFHMAYGLYDQAADLIRIAIGREPGRRDLKLKLLEVFFVWGNKDQFLQTARELAESRADAAPGEWEKILIMGKQLAPEDPLFSGGGAVTGAAAGGVDLDLEGGQSRVDFDLLGEPVAAEGGQGVDLDIGAAVGDQAESTTNITDRNAALAEGNFGNNTGTTRQMTARVRSTGATGEMEGPTVEQPALTPPSNPTLRQKVETAMRQGGTDQTSELAIDDLGLDLGQVDTVDQPGIAAAANSHPDSPTLVAGLDEQSRKVIEGAQQRAVKDETGAWSFDQNELEAALTQTSLSALPDASPTARLAALKGRALDVDVGDATGTHSVTATDIDLDVGAATGTHPTNGGGLDLDVGTATVPDTAFAATQKLSSEDLALPDLEPVTMSEVGTKLDLARAYMDMGDPDGARNILEEVLNEGSAAQKQEAQRLMESLPG